jgi:hypothetical protein
MVRMESESDDEWQTVIIFRPYRTLPDGSVLWAKHYGKKAWAIPIRVRKKPPEKPSDDSTTPNPG